MRGNVPHERGWAVANEDAVAAHGVLLALHEGAHMLLDADEEHAGRRALGRNEDMRQSPLRRPQLRRCFGEAHLRIRVPARRACPRHKPDQ